MSERHPQFHGSPLIAPATCMLVLLAPTQRDLVSIARKVRANLRRNFARIVSAANVVNVPTFMYSPCSHAARHGLAARLARFSYQEFVAGTDAFPWQHSAFRDAIAKQDRSAIVMAGFWLEHQVVATALHALADSYDVYFVLDASPAKMQAAIRLSQDRLIQAGATPVVISQVIHEWLLETTDPSKTEALRELLLPSVITNAG
jgi:hypothetical protein